MSRGIVLALLLTLAWPPAQALPSPGLDARLPTDPRLVTGRLDNGLTYVIRRHAGAEPRIGIWLHVATGSLNETDATRGLAHYLEHLAFNGSANFPPGSLVPLFESFGLTFGRDKNAFTTFDQTTYQVMVPAGKADALDKALLFMADVASRLDLSEVEIENERGIILEEKRARASGAQRVQDEVLARIAPESTLGRRLPIGTEAAIRAVTRADFLEYYRRWYVPSNMTVIVAGDADPAAVSALIARHFGGAAAGPRPEPHTAGVQPTAGTRAIVATDPELTRADVSFVRLEPPRPPSLTVGEFRRDVVEAIGASLLGRRFEADAAQGRARFESAHASLYQWPRIARNIVVGAAGRPHAWREMLADLGEGVQRARQHGFSEREVQDARQALLSEARDAVARDATAPLRSILSAMNRAVTRQEPIMAPAQRLALLEQLLPGITAPEVSATFAATFDTTSTVIVAKLPATGSVPDEAAVARVGRVALDVTPAPAPERERPASLLAAPPAAGTIVERRTDATSGVTSFWLDNGVRGHHRAMDERKGEVVVVVTLAGGIIEENPPRRGITEAALQAWVSPATSRLTSTDIRDLLVGKRVGVHASVGEDAVTLTVRTTPEDVETALQLVHLLLTDPVIEPVALARWTEAQLEWVERRRVEPIPALRTLAAETLAPAGEVRMRPLRGDEITAIGRDAAQAWLRRVVATAPIETATVGNIEEARALQLVATYLGSLPRRDRIGGSTLAALRNVAPPPGPIHVARTVDTRTPQAAVLAGFRGADARDRRDARLLAVAARVLSTRMHRVLREERQLVYSIGAVSRPSWAYPGFGAFVAEAPTDPARAPALAAEIEAMYAHFGTEGPTEDEVAIARRQLVNQLDDQLQRPDVWASRLAAIDYRGESPRELLEARRQYEQASTPDVHDAFRRYYRPAARFTIVVSPAGPAAPAEPPAAPEPAATSPR
jgi:zinc protease